ncbi:MAG TPA: hypothetical protein VIZ28_14445 [Chitinophagaceae bacterium]
MKKLFIVLAVASLGFVACNNEAEKTETTDTPKVETPAPAVVDSPAVVVDSPAVKVDTPAKK